MSRQAVFSPQAPTLVVPISHAVKAAGLLFVSGNSGREPTELVATGDFEAQFHKTMRNLKVITEDAGGSLDNAVKVNVYLKRQSDFDTLNKLYVAYFKDGNYPARTTLCVADFGKPGMLIEMECIVAL